MSFNPSFIYQTGKLTHNDIGERSHAAMLMDLESILQKLTAIQPPCSHPLMGLLSRTQALLAERFAAEQAMGRQQERLRFAKIGYQSSTLLMQGFRTGTGGGIVCEGHPLRFLAIAFLVEVAVALAEGQGIMPWETSSPSSYFSRLPSIPPPEKETVLMLMRQLTREMRIGYGDDAEISEVYVHTVGFVRRFLARQQ